MSSKQGDESWNPLSCLPHRFIVFSTNFCRVSFKNISPTIKYFNNFIFAPSKCIQNTLSITVSIIIGCRNRLKAHSWYQYRCFKIPIFLPNPRNVQLRQHLKGKKGKGSFYIAQYPVRWTAQSAVHFLPSLADLFIPTPTRFLREAF